MNLKRPVCFSPWIFTEWTQVNICASQNAFGAMHQLNLRQSKKIKLMKSSFGFSNKTNKNKWFSVITLLVNNLAAWNILKRISKLSEVNRIWSVHRRYVCPENVSREYDWMSTAEDYFDQSFVGINQNCWDASCNEDL